ncbi:4'-phosphopantetheinyl transferase superfamily protein [Dyadobacter sp. CY323]|uniref:4'-phosphopantetheinyl transferase family protein n=1 Tax=Dyadobacter sp. CY323 TaxID=2907302 RepID=UPI001F41E061|nr:4'-phosphopantetheinyl transferase superfamily protein [Dyadobacter sp. CY323]MCE6992545.1 4'-phosphopantetheinyl transferase superfamily protein [Dyadobacter sp. CY323]
MGISYIKKLSEDAQIGLWQMTESWQELRELVELTETDQRVLTEKKTDNRRQEWLACRALLKNMSGRDAEIVYHENGKPFLKGNNHFISMSHSGAFVCVYLDNNKSIGIDIQKIKPGISKGSDFFLNEEEQMWVDADDNLLLHTIWSAKESVFKFAGNPDFDLKKHIVTNPFSGNQKGSIEVKLIHPDHTESVQVGYDNFEDYVLTWTV